MMYVIIASEDRDTDRYPSPLIEKGRDASSCARCRVAVEQMDLFCPAVKNDVCSFLPLPIHFLTCNPLPSEVCPVARFVLPLAVFASGTGVIVRLYLTQSSRYVPQRSFARECR